MTRPLKRALLLSCLLFLLGAAAVGAREAGGGGYTFARSVIAGGGGHSAAGVMQVRGTIGQAVVGRRSSGVFDLCSGFWCEMTSLDHHVFLPLVLRG